MLKAEARALSKTLSKLVPEEKKLIIDLFINELAELEQTKLRGIHRILRHQQEEN